MKVSTPVNDYRYRIYYINYYIVNENENTNSTTYTTNIFSCTAEEISIRLPEEYPMTSITARIPGIDGMSPHLQVKTLPSSRMFLVSV